MKRFMNLFRNSSRPAAKSARPSLEALEDRQLLSGSTLTPPTDLPAGLVNKVAKAEYVMDNGQLTRADVLNLLAVVDGTEKASFGYDLVAFTPVKNPNLDATLSGKDLTALQTLFQDGSLWGLTPDVENLGSKVVNYNPANVNYQGSSLLPSGQLAKGDEKWQMQDLVDKWFYGTDLPAIGGTGASYYEAKGSLFGPNGPSPSDVAQGAIGDCYFLSSLAETAQQDPKAIKNMFINDGNGIYTVRFYEYNATSKTWQADYVTVNSELPGDANGDFIYANTDQYGQTTSVTSSSDVLWVALAEKAYAQLAAEGWSRQIGTPDGSGVSGNPADNSNAYSSLNYGANKIAEQQITGSDNASRVSFPSNHKQEARNNLNTILTDFSNGDLITFATDKNAHTKTTGLLGYHVYYMTGYNAATQTVTLVNPYWDNGEKTVTVTLAELEQDFQGAAVIVPDAKS